MKMNIYCISLIINSNHVNMYVLSPQFMRPRSRDKKLLEEWAIPLKNVEDINEVQLLLQNGSVHFPDNSITYIFCVLKMFALTEI